MQLFKDSYEPKVTDENRLLIERIGISWYRKIGRLFDEGKLIALSEKVAQRRALGVVYPESKDVFNAFKLTPFETVKVVILGQDPYHDGNADGLAFSCKNNISPSLKVILEEIDRELHWPDSKIVEECYLSTIGSLAYWAKQGVFLLNTSLTVDKGVAGSHSGFGWELLIKKTLEVLIEDDKPKVFLLWGVHAQRLFDNIKDKEQDKKHHLILKTAHPVAEIYKAQGKPISGSFYGTKIFIDTNEFLKKHKQTPIIW